MGHEWIPSDDDRAPLMQALGIQSTDALFSDIPASLRLKQLHLPAGRSQAQAWQEITATLAKNGSADSLACFLGGGVYHHHTPAAVKHIIGRSEFYTAYTPYQAEASQGSLQALYEYQSYLAELVGLDVVNSSVYDGHTAVGEALRLAVRHTNRHRVVVPAVMDPDKRSVVDNYLHRTPVTVDACPLDPMSGTLDLAALRGLLSDQTAALYVENPAYLGSWEASIGEIADAAHKVGALLIVGVNPLSLGIAKAPGDYGADIVVGEGQPLGNPLWGGGPHFGIFAVSRTLMRQLPGRVVGRTSDARGDDAYCLTLQTREQHIRRSKATSNICTNQALCALAAVTYMALLGRSGLRRLSTQLARSARDFARRIDALEGYEAPIFDAPFFNEFAWRTQGSAKTLHKALLDARILGGTKLHANFPELGQATLSAVTELTTKAQMDAFVKVLEAHR